MEGWVKLHRCLIEKAIWQQGSPEQKVILITLLAMANHKEKQWEWQGEKFEAKPGQFITSLDQLVKKCGVGIKTQNVRTALARFEKLEFLTNISTKTGRLITIVNWQVYQSEEETPNIDTNKGLAKTKQRPNKDLTPNNNDKTEKNDKNTYGEFKKVLLTNDEHDRLISKYGKELAEKAIVFLDLHIEEKSYISKSHVAAIQKWVVSAVQKQQPFGKQPEKRKELPEH